MAHGKTLELREIVRPAPESVIQHPEPVKGRGGLFTKPRGMETYANEAKDRTLRGKARRRARKAARGLARRPFFKGHGVASENAYNLRYDCLAPDCGFGIVAPLDDWDFMTDVMEHEQWHHEETAS